ncbi:MAG: hypothetical protein ACK4XK_07245, partial [Casimicrobiaceae bacterium]
KETGYGMAFAPRVEESAASAATEEKSAPGTVLAPVVSDPSPEAQTETKSPEVDAAGRTERPERKRPALTVVK